MVPAQVCDTEAEIRQLLEEDLERLMQGKQEVVVYQRGNFRPVTGTIESYIAPGDPAHDKEDCDQLFIETRKNMGYAFSVSDVAKIEVLSSQRMSNELGLEQSRQMESIITPDKK